MRVNVASEWPAVPNAEDSLDPVATEPRRVEPRTDVGAAEQVLGRVRFCGASARVVGSPLLGVTEDGLGGGDLLEALDGRGVLVAVRVETKRELAERFPPRARVSVMVDAEDLVVVGRGGPRHP